jgi:hypothetical protein
MMPNIKKKVRTGDSGSELVAMGDFIRAIVKGGTSKRAPLGRQRWRSQLA